MPLRRAAITGGIWKESNPVRTKGRDLGALQSRRVRGVGHPWWFCWFSLVTTSGPVESSGPAVAQREETVHGPRVMPGV